MILGPVSLLDIALFLICLAPQLLYHVGLLGTAMCLLKAVPFLVVKLPFAFCYEHIFVWKRRQTPFVRQASLFEDMVIRCVRYAFANLPANVGKVFFSKSVAVPFLRFRMLRHGLLRSPLPWEAIATENFKGILMLYDRTTKPDIVIYYAHGGGFAMGSSYFYLEFLLTWTYLLKAAGFKNPAILALEYGLVPKSCYPTQLEEAIAGYLYIVSDMNVSPERICVSGDSAGGTIILSLLLRISRPETLPVPEGQTSQIELDSPENNLKKPAMALLISPWTILASGTKSNTSSDYLDCESLALYARQYAGRPDLLSDPLASPGDCQDLSWWREASPSKGWFFMWGSEEVFAPEIKRLISTLIRAGRKVRVVNGDRNSDGTSKGGLETVVEGEESQGSIHAAPITQLFLKSDEKERLKGLRSLVAKIRERML